MMKALVRYFSREEKLLWISSVSLIVLSFCMFDRENYMTLVAWLKNPFNGNKAEVAVNRISRREKAFMWGLTVVVTVLFYFILEFFGTANIVPSTLSVTTSFVAVYLTFRRSAYFAVAYAANDLVLILLWMLASVQDVRYISVVVCFVAFFVNDVYGFLSWRKMEQRQSRALAAEN